MNTTISGFETTPCMEADTNKVFGGEYNIPIDFDAPRILDIGACHGAFALWAKVRWKDAHVTSVEPSAEAFTLLEKNTDGHGVDTINAAVSTSGKDQMPLFRGKATVGANSLYTDAVPVGHDHEMVPVIGPDWLTECDVLKMDCEGAELDILLSYPHLSGVKAVLFEYHTEENYASIDNLLLSDGFTRMFHKSAHPSLGICGYVRDEVLAAFYEEYETRVLIVSPIYKGDGHPMFKKSVRDTLNALAEAGIYASYTSILGDAHIDRARSGLLGAFLAEPHFTHIFMVDADIEWHPTVVEALLNHNVPCVGAAYTFKAEEGPLANKPVVRSWGAGSKADERGLAPVRFLAGGFVLCQRELIERMCAAEPHLKFDTNPGHGFGYQMETYALWQAIIVPQPEWGEGKFEMLSEDYSFCERINRLGEVCWLDIYAQLAHWDKDKAFILKPKDEKAA